MLEPVRVAHGHYKSSSTGVAITVTTAGTPVIFGDATHCTAGKENGTIVTAGATPSIKTKRKGTYLVGFAGHFLGANNAVVQASLFQNSTELANTVSERKEAGTALGAQQSAQTLVDLAEGDTIALYVDSDTNSDTVTVKNLSVWAILQGPG